jgi:hypothetical protein
MKNLTLLFALCVACKPQPEKPSKEVVQAASSPPAQAPSSVQQAPSPPPANLDSGESWRIGELNEMSLEEQRRLGLQPQIGHSVDGAPDHIKTYLDQLIYMCGEPAPMTNGFVDVTFDGKTTRYLYGGKRSMYFGQGICCEPCANAPDEDRPFQLLAGASPDFYRDSIDISARNVSFHDGEGDLWISKKTALTSSKFGERLEGKGDFEVSTLEKGKTKITKPLHVEFSLPREQTRKTIRTHIE